MKTKENRTSRKLSFKLIGITILLLSTCMLALAISLEKIKIEDNVFQIGNIDINLNNGQAIINNDFLLEPGATIEKDFFIENVGSSPAYFKLYFKDIEGKLAEILDVKIKENDKVLYSGKLADLTRFKVKVNDDILDAKEKKELKLIIKTPEDTPNAYQNSKLTFVLSADAVQTKNNDKKEFN